MHCQDIQNADSQFFCPTYARYPLCISRGQGCELFTPEGRRYVDLLSGIAVCVLGHAHPELAETIANQARKLLHVSNLFFQEEQILLAEKLLSTCHCERVFLCNSGAEANEGAIKLARRYMRTVRNEERFEILTLKGSFHGRTLATLTATGQEKIKEGFGPLPQGFSTVPPEDIHALQQAISPQTAALMLEVIQGEGGVRPLSADYLKKASALCAEHGILLIVDEIQTGMGRTGSYWAFQQTGLQPDIFTVAKGLAGGLPIGAVLCSQEISKAFTPGSHGTTFGGNPLACAAANTVLQIIERDHLCAHAATLGSWLLRELQSLRSRHAEYIADVRGQGLMLGIEFSMDAKSVWEALLEKGFIVNVTQQNVLRLLPPLILTKDIAQAFVTALENVLQSLGAQS